MSEPIGIIIQARDAASRVGILLRDWCEHFHRCKQAHAFYVVDDGSKDDTAGVVERLREKNPQIQLLKHDTSQGFGACLRTGLAAVTEPHVAVVTLDYSYKPTDLELLVKRLDQKLDVFGTEKVVGAVNGWRTGHPTPAFWRGVGWFYRYGCRIALGFKPEPLAGWLGFRNHFRSWWLWLAMGVPLVDVCSGLKVFRRELFDRVPIQSAGDFAHAEVIAKLTFLGALLAEEPLPPRSDAIPATEFSEFWTVLNGAKFKEEVSTVNAVITSVECGLESSDSQPV
jgi:glycosyltransferase involved in cell wall biosynthesis